MGREYVKKIKRKWGISIVRCNIYIYIGILLIRSVVTCLFFMWYYDSKNSDRWFCCRFQFRLRFPLRICLSCRLPTSMVSHTFCFVALFAQILHIRTVVAPKNNSQKNLNNLNIRYDSDLNSDCLTISIIISHYHLDFFFFYFCRRFVLFDLI